MKIKPFKLERYFAQYEFSAPYLLSCSDCEPLTLKELMDLSDPDTRRLFDELWLGYTDSQGHSLLREEVAKLHTNIPKENVVISAPEEGIFIAMNVLLSKEDHIIVTYPGYQSLYEVANSIGCEISKWKMKEGTFTFNIEDLEKLIKPNTKLIVINFPHNPTGYLPSQEEFLRIIELAKRKGIYVFSDEMYRFLEYDPHDRLPSASDLYDKAVSLFGVSKSFALAGLRIGWLTSQNNDLIKDIINFKDYTTICSSAPSEILALTALRSKTEILLRNHSIIKTNLDILDIFFNKYKRIFHWIKPKAGTVAFLQLINGKKALDLAQDLIKKKGVMLLPSSVYDHEGENLRFGFGRKNMSEVLSKFEEYLKEKFRILIK